ncbi:MAG TPA: hypothetical protein VKV26_12670 [Dehalococcoidia bacterium]|nr:hypothetical protein [Dehalococcoidia bacterium]
MATEIVDEAERMRRVPGIMFTGAPGHRKARIIGHRIDVWYIIQCCRDAGGDRARLPEYLETLTPEEIDAGLRYYELYPEEIDKRLEINAKIAAYAEAHPGPFFPPFPQELNDLLDM